MPAPDFDESAAHRWFAIEFNNQAWGLAEAASRTADETERMLRLAHASCLHWSAVGEPINRLRGLNLLTFACAVAGQAPLAASCAERCLSLSAELDDRQTPFDRASAAAGMACALRCNGRAAEAQVWETQTRAAMAQLADAEEAQVIERLLSRAPDGGGPA